MAVQGEQANGLRSKSEGGNNTGRVRKELFQKLRQPLKGDKECEGRERVRASQMQRKSENNFIEKKLFGKSVRGPKVF